MKLKHIELVGFKSFAQKTRLEFMPGIVAIVGPNGSGKSNITDAIRWILGEQSSSNLRSSKIEDLIFSGTPGRPSMGLAQVSIHLDNASGQIPVDFSDVAIMRKVSRDGASEFYLNDSRVRLRDIVDLFARARLGVRGIAVINQGASDVFLRATPAERREMIEEMLGLKEYRIKKRDAENKLRNTEENLSKAHALLEEIRPHLRMLKRQTNRWERRREVEEELRMLEKDHFLRRLTQLGTQLAGIDERRRMTRERVDRARAILEERQKSVEQTERAQPELLEELSALRAQKNELEREKGELSRTLGHLEGKLEAVREVAVKERVVAQFDVEGAKRLIEDIRAGVSRILSAHTVEEAREGARSLHEKIEQFTRGDEKEGASDGVDDDAQRADAAARIEEEIHSAADSVSRIEEKLVRCMEKEEAIAAQVSDANAEFQGVYRAQQESTRELSRLEQELGNINVDEERIKVRLEDLQARIREAGWDPADLDAAAEGYEFEEFDFDVEQRILKLRKELAAIGEIDEALLHEARETEERNEFLSAQVEDLERAKKDTAALIGDLDVKIHEIFDKSLRKINAEFQHFFTLMFGGGRARLELATRRKKKKSAFEMIGSEIGSEDGEEEEEEISEAEAGIDIFVDLPRKKIKSIDMLSGGERSLVSIAALFSLVAVSPPPFLVLDEIDAALDEVNARRFANLLRDLSEKTQFIVVTHNRVTMEAADALYGVTMGDDGISKVLSLRLEKAEEYVR